MADASRVVLQAEPGAGKTTVVPLRLLDEPWLAGQTILMAEPRRLAARASAQRMAELIGDRVGDTVGFRTRDESKVGPRTRIEVVTEGIVVRRLQNDPTLDGVGLVIFDEFHERSLMVDLALAFTLEAQAALVPDLRVLVMSATIDTKRTAAKLAGSADGGVRGAEGSNVEGSSAQGSSVERSSATGAEPTDPVPVVTSAGRTFPVEVEWRPRPADQRIEAATVAAVRRCLGAVGGAGGASGPTDESGIADGDVADGDVFDGDVLVFLPGAGPIRRVQEALAGVVDGAGRPVDVRPLFGAMDRAGQDLALIPSADGRRKVVLATDIAETSLTVEGVTWVVDAGQVRQPRFAPATGMTTLVTTTNSKASADQRAGRAGRTQPGRALRLWSQAEHATRADFTPPEITQVDLAGLALELAVWGVDDPGELILFDPPPAPALAEARELLTMLGALEPVEGSGEAGTDQADQVGRITEMGRAMARLPLHPRLARMVLAAAVEHRWMASVMAALLDERDVLRGHPRDLPVDLGARVALVGSGGGRGRGDGRDRGRDAEKARRDFREGQIDGGAVRRVRDRARQVERRARGEGQGQRQGQRRQAGSDRDGGAESGRSREIDVDMVGELLAWAYPDRIAQQRGGPGRFRLRNGRGAAMEPTDGLSREPFIVVASIDGGQGGGGLGRPGSGAGGGGAGGDGQIRIAAALDESSLPADAVESVEVVEWDEARNDLVARRVERVGALVLRQSDRSLEAGPAAVAALLDRVRDQGLELLEWTKNDLLLRDRIGFAHAHFGDPWPDVSDQALLDALDEWLAPFLTGATRRRDLVAVSISNALRAWLGYPHDREIDQLVPVEFTLANGTTRKLRYEEDRVVLSTRAQDLYGTTVHPVLGGDGSGKPAIPIAVELLSPAQRPIQITSDLPGFWAGSWAEVRKDMNGRYPKHDWPTNPAEG